MHVYRICNSTDYINAHHTIVYTYLILYCKDIHQPLSTITHDEWDVSIPGIIDPLCIGRCVFGTSLFTPARFHGGGSARKSCLFSHGFMPFFIWLHQQTIIRYLDGDEVEIAGNYCPSHRCTVPVPIILWPLWSGHAPGHIALAAAALDVVVAVDVAAATAVAFAFVALT